VIAKEPFRADGPDGLRCVCQRKNDRHGDNGSSKT
jgi:hypothetical protein